MIGIYLRQDQHRKVDSHVAGLGRATDLTIYKQGSRSQRAGPPYMLKASERAKCSVVVLGQGRLSMRGRIIQAIQHCRSYDSHVHNPHVVTILQFLICPPRARLIQSVSDATYVPEALSQPDTEDGVQISVFFFLPRRCFLFSVFLKQPSQIMAPDSLHMLRRQRYVPNQIVPLHILLSQVYKL